MSLSTFAKNKILDYLLKGIAFTVNPVYVSLHTATPGLTGASEVSGGSYARQAANAANWTAAAAESRLEFILRTWVCGMR